MVVYSFSNDGASILLKIETKVRLALLSTTLRGIGVEAQ